MQTLCLSFGTRIAAMWQPQQSLTEKSNAAWCSFRCVYVILQNETRKNTITCLVVSICRILPSLCKTSSMIHEHKSRRLLYVRGTQTRLIPSLMGSTNVYKSMIIYRIPSSSLPDKLRRVPLQLLPACTQRSHSAKSSGMAFSIFQTQLPFFGLF